MVWPPTGIGPAKSWPQRIGGKARAFSPPAAITSLARGASNECDTAVALPLTAVSSQNVIGSFEARFFLRSWRENVLGGRGSGRARLLPSQMPAPAWLSRSFALPAPRQLGVAPFDGSVPTACHRKAVLNQVFADGPDGGLSAVRDADLPQDVLDVLFDGLVADPQAWPISLFVSPKASCLSTSFSRLVSGTSTSPPTRGVESAR